MKPLILVFLLTALTAQAFASLLKCSAMTKEHTVKLDLKDKTHGAINTNEVACDFEVASIRDLRESQIPKIEIEMFRPYQCSPSTKLEPEIEKNLKLELFVTKNTVKRANLVWRKYEPRVSCKIEELNFAELSKAATKNKR